MPDHDDTFVRQVFGVLNPKDSGWHPLSVSVLLAHIETYLPLLSHASVQFSGDYYALVFGAVEASRLRPVQEEIAQLYVLSRRATSIINNVAYHAMLTGRDRETLYTIAEKTKEMVDELIGAPRR